MRDWHPCKSYKSTKTLLSEYCSKVEYTCDKIYCGTTQWKLLERRMREIGFSCVDRFLYGRVVRTECINTGDLPIFITGDLPIFITCDDYRWYHIKKTDSEFDTH